MPAITMDKGEFKKARNNLSSANERILNSKKEGKFVLEIGKSDMECVTNYVQTIEKLQTALDKYYTLLDKDIENLKNVQDKMELLDVTIAEEIAG